MMWPGFTEFGRSFDPLQEMVRLQRDINDLFSNVSRFVGGEFPAVNVWVGNNQALVTSELPGMSIDGIEIAVMGDILTLAGRRDPAALKEGENYLRQERQHGHFRRTVRLPFKVDPAKVEARYEKGLLKITLARAEEDKPRKIAIKTT